MISNLIHRLNASFTLKDLGHLSCFLGIQMQNLGSGILLNQSKYVDDLLFKLQLHNMKSAPSPCVVGKQLSIFDGSPMHNLSLYRSTVGALQYLTQTRSDIAYIVNHLSQFLRAPTNTHWHAVRRVLWYLISTKHYGIHIQLSFDFNIVAYSYADWASNIDDRKSIAAFCVFMGNNLVS